MNRIVILLLRETKVGVDLVWECQLLFCLLNVAGFLQMFFPPLQKVNLPVSSPK